MPLWRQGKRHFPFFSAWLVLGSLSASRSDSASKGRNRGAHLHKHDDEVQPLRSDDGALAGPPLPALLLHSRHKSSVCYEYCTEYLALLGKHEKNSGIKSQSFREVLLSMLLEKYTWLQKADFFFFYFRSLLRSRQLRALYSVRTL